MLLRLTDESNTYEIFECAHVHCDNDLNDWTCQTKNNIAAILMHLSAAIDLKIL